MSTVDEIKNRIDIVDLVSENVKLRKSGKNYLGFCPFHENKRTPAFVVFPDSGTWRCFGQCNEGGDIFKYVMKKEGWDFPETLKYLAERAGVELEPLTPQKQEQSEQYERLRTLLEDVVNFYRHHLLQTPAGKPALEYLHKRGLNEDTITTFGLGYAPDGWDSALKYFTQKGYSNAELVQVGLVSERQQSEGVYDRFRNRVMFPIRDGAGKMAGFGARVLDPNDVPKFLNSPQTILFDKGHLLYGLDLARKSIRAQDQVVIVEGYLDVIVPHQAGFTNLVSPMGTALTEDQLRLLKRFTRRIVLALDADAAGEKATLRGLELARQTLDHSEEVTFDPRGLLRNEARLEADVRVTTLPPGMDPDEVVLRNPEEWTKIIAAAKPVVIHVMETLAADQNLEDPKVKSEIAAQVLPLIEDVPNPVERDAYRQRLARLLKIDERSLIGSGKATSSRRKPARRVQPTGEQTRPVSVQMAQVNLATALEKHCLRLLLLEPDRLYSLDRELQKAGLSRFSAQELERAEHQQLAELVEKSLNQELMDAPHYLKENIPEHLEDLAQELLQPNDKDDPLSERLLEDLIRSVMKLRLIRVNESIKQLRFLVEEMEQTSDGSLNPYQDLMMQYTLIRGRLDLALGHPLQLD
ncbi:MAG: DNA primase [Anaerolineaceae bacterium]